MRRTPRLPSDSGRHQEIGEELSSIRGVLLWWALNKECVVDTLSMRTMIAVASDIEMDWEIHLEEVEFQSTGDGPPERPPPGEPPILPGDPPEGEAFAENPTSGGAPTTIDPGRSKCPYCGDDVLGQALVLCPRCHTPHHSACWTENGGRCTTFACADS